MASVFGRVRQYLEYRTVFRSHRDVEAYRRVRDHPDRCAGPVALHLRAVPQGPLYCRPGTMDPITLWDAYQAGYHLPTFALPAPRLILDLGANVGYTAASLAARYPTARVLAVEMDAENAALCAQNLAPFGTRCEVIHAAVWVEPGAIAYAGGDVHAYAILPGAAAGARTAPAVTIDGLLQRFPGEVADYIKMDIEGAEAEVLRPPLAWASRVKSLSLEVHPPATIERCRSALAAHGFACHVHPAHPHSLVARRD